MSLSGLRNGGATLVALAIGLLPVSGAIGGGNAVPGSNVARYLAGITANALKPVACAGIAPATVVAGNTGTSGADLLLGSAAANTLYASSGNDCVLGGGGNDSINCGAGIDVAVGGPGTDTFNSNCETRVQ